MVTSLVQPQPGGLSGPSRTETLASAQAGASLPPRGMDAQPILASGSGTTLKVLCCEAGRADWRPPTGSGEICTGSPERPSGPGLNAIVPGHAVETFAAKLSDTVCSPPRGSMPSSIVYCSPELHGSGVDCGASSAAAGRPVMGRNKTTNRQRGNHGA